MLKKYGAIAAVVLVAMAWLDVETGVQGLDQLIRAVPIEWLRGVAGV